MKRASILTFKNFTYINRQFSFIYSIDGKDHQIDLSYSEPSPFSEEILYTIGFNLGMCYLLDIAEITLPQKIEIFACLQPFQLDFWRRLYEDVIKEKLFALKLSLSLAEISWEDKPDGPNFKPFSINNQKEGYSICLTGGKESLALLKMLERKKDITLFYLNLEASVRRQKVFNKFQDTFRNITTISNRTEILTPLKKEYGIIFSGVDMAHLVFNTLVFAQDYTSVLIGNEYSSNFPNEIYQGYAINHQFVKTIEFAKRINKYIHTFVTKNYSYYSPFFALYEYRIADILFSDDNYFDIWTSCNQTNTNLNFCSNCHKCAFTYLISRVRREEQFLSQFFSRDLLEDVELFKPLIDFVGEKPLDCVGDKKEVWVALYTLMKKGTENKVITYFKENILPQISHEIDDYVTEVTSIQSVPIETPQYLQDLVKEALLH